MDVMLKTGYPRLKGVYDNETMTLFVLEKYKSFMEDEHIFTVLRSTKGIVSIPSLMIFTNDEETQNTLDSVAAHILGYNLERFDIGFLNEEQREKVYTESECVHADFSRDFYTIMEFYHMCYSANASHGVTKNEIRNKPFMEVW